MNELDNTEATIKRLEPVINGMNLSELRIANQMIVSRIKTIHKAGALMHLSKFNIGDRVSWLGNDGSTRSGIIIRLNQKTASIKTAEGQWNVSPHFLTKA